MTSRSKFDWGSIIKFNISLLKISGLWPKDNQGYKNNFYTVYAFVVLILFIVLDTLCQINNLYFIRHDLEALTGTIFLLLTKIASCFKSYFVIKNMKSLKNLMVLLQTDLFQPQSDRQIVLIQPNFDIWRHQFYGIWSCTIGCLSFMLIFPLFDKKNYRLPSLSWYPFDYTVGWLYYIVYFHQVLSNLICAIANVSIDTLVSGLNMYIASQFDILCDNLKNLKVVKATVKCKLRNCVKHHKLILR